MNIDLNCEDAEGGSWTEEAEIHGRTEDELIDSAIEAAQNCFAPAWDAEGRDIDGPVIVTCDVNDHRIEVKNEDDITVY